jgi:hypothetical protein
MGRWCFLPLFLSNFHCIVTDLTGELSMGYGGPSVIYLGNNLSTFQLQDYGIDFDDVNHPVKAFKCRCGSEFCRDKSRFSSKYMTVAFMMHLTVC